jgi:hypothetical protein
MAMGITWSSTYVDCELREKAGRNSVLKRTNFGSFFAGRMPEVAAALTTIQTSRIAMATRKTAIISQQQIESAVLVLRGEKVLLDADLAAMYGVTTKALNQAVRRNRSRFPPDFMFRLTKEELENWRSQVVTSNPAAKMGLRRAPYAFTEQGVAMLSSVLRSERAVRVNVEIMRAFVRLRRVLAVNAELAGRLDELERRVGRHDEQFTAVIRAIRQLMEPVEPAKRRKIGFHVTHTDSAPPSATNRTRRA